MPAAFPNQPLVTPLPENTDRTAAYFHQRLCRFSREVSGVLNSLGLSGILTGGGLAGGGPGSVSLSNLIFFGDGAPPAAEGMSGDYYVDLLTGNVFVKN